jgi:PD-(D/E)XK nuclease superfamily
MGLTPRGENPDARWFGIGVHLALAEWYQKGKRRGRHPAETFDEWCGDQIAYIYAQYPDRERTEYDAPKYEDAHDLGIAMLEAYVNQYGRDDRWLVLATEQQFKVNVMHHGKPIARFMSTFDGVFRDEEDGRIYLMEHKTAGQIQLAYLDLDPQAGAYWAVAAPICRKQGWLGPGEVIAGIQYNFLRKAMPDERPRNELGECLNKDGTVSKRQPPPAFVRHIVERAPEEAHTEMELLEQEVQWMQAMRDGTMPIRKVRTRECTYCDFFDVCKLGQRGQTAALREFIKIKFHQSDPFDRYVQKSASE